MSPIREPTSSGEIKELIHEANFACRSGLFQEQYPRRIIRITSKPLMVAETVDELVIPMDSRFIDLDGDEGELKVPAGIFLQQQGSR
jgi:hypothetical protein